MADSENQEKRWCDVGIWRFFTFTVAVIQQFTIDPNLSLVEQQALKEKFKTFKVHGVCKTCKVPSSVDWKNPWNWVRHLNNVSLMMIK